MNRDTTKRARDSRTNPAGGLPLRGVSRTHTRVVIAHHLVLHGYGHWLPNDPRGSGSDKIREHKLADLGPVHTGRKRVQPPRDVLKDFYRRAEPRLDFPTLWFNDAKTQAIAGAVARVIASRHYTVWACAILTDHAHLCIRRHRHEALTMWRAVAQESAEALRPFAEVPDGHPIWSARPYKVFLYTPDDVRRVIVYIRSNPVQEGLPAQHWTFVQPYDGWPEPRRKR